MCSSNTLHWKHHLDPWHRSSELLMLGMLPFIHCATAISRLARDSATISATSVLLPMTLPLSLLHLYCNFMFPIALPLLTAALQLSCWELSNWKTSQILTYWSVWMHLDAEASSAVPLRWPSNATALLLLCTGLHHYALHCCCCLCFPLLQAFAL